MKDHSQNGSTRAQARRALEGDQQGLTRLYERLAPALYAWATIRIHPRHRGRLDPNDVVQDTWWRALHAFNQFDPEKGSFRAWIFRIATNVLTDGYRRLSVRGQLQNNDLRARTESMPEDVVAELTSISQAAARNDDVALILEAVGKLELDDRSLLAYCGLECLTAVDAAPLLGIAPEACTKRWQRLRAQLRESPTWNSFLVVFEAD